MSVTLIPSSFYDKACAREYLAQVVDIAPDAVVNSAFLPQFDAYFVYEGREKPALLDILNRLLSISDYNKVLCNWDGSTLSLGIAQGKSLLLANTFKAEDFVTAMYFILLSMKSLQLNPEVSTVFFISPLTQDQKVSLFHYFKSVAGI